MEQYESSVKHIPFSQERVYAKLEDLNNLEAVKGKVPEDKVKKFEYSHDEATIDVPPIGNVTIRVVEREEPKCIKFEVVGSPFPTNMWIQIIADGNQASKMRVVVKTDINFMFRSMIEKPLKDGIEKVAEALSKIEY